MDKDFSDSDLQATQEDHNGQSLVGKLKKNVSEIISNTPLSKWFRKQNDDASSSVRRRQEDSEDEEDLQELQPPAKRTRLPPTKETLSLNVSEVLSPISSINTMKRPLYRNFPEPIPGPSGYQTHKMLNSTSAMSENSIRITKSTEDNEIFKNPKPSAESSEQTNKESNSDSEESTSGYSSGRVGSKEMVSQESSKQTSPLQNSPRKNRSLFHGSSSSRLFVSDRSLSPNRNSSLSSRLPSFNPSTFGSSSFVDRTLSSKRILNSPFYNGHTIYGGASAYGRSTKRAPQDIQKILRQSVRIKPVNKGKGKGDAQLGKTARRILDTLEQYSSPVSDAKKIPVAWKKSKTEGSLTRYIGANPYVLRESRSASSRELQVPSVTDLLKMKMDQQKTRLQDSTEAARQIATKSSSASNNESYQIPVQRENEKHTSKMKTKITSVRHKVQIEETVPMVNLNPVSLPIKELPKFDIPIPPPTQKSLSSPAQTPFAPPVQTSSLSAQKPLATTTASSFIVFKPVSPGLGSKNLDEKGCLDNKLPLIKSKENDDIHFSEFKFSAPLVLAEYLKPLKALNNFKFSEPLIKKRRSIHAELDDQENKIIDTGKTKKNNGEHLPNDLKVTGNSVGSALDKFKPKEGTWECSACLIRNQPDKIKCAACEAPKSKSKCSVEPPVQSFGQPFKLKPAEGTWECPTCMIRNKEELQKCAACEEKKPDKSALSRIPKFFDYCCTPPVTLNKPSDKHLFADTLWECPSCHTKGSQMQKIEMHQCTKSDSGDATSSSDPASKTFNIVSKFKPANTWECSTCLIRNKDELAKCAACESPKPPPKDQSSQQGFSTTKSSFKKKDDEWECQVCMVRNKASTDSCVCCQSSNPQVTLAKSASSGASPPKAAPSFNFGIDKKTATSFTFGIPPDSQTNQADPKTNASLIFGETRQQPSSVDSKTPSFTFGVPSKDSKASEVKNDPPKSGEILKTDSTKTLKVGGDAKTAEDSSSKPAPIFSFGTDPKAATSISNKAAPTVTFGAETKGAEATTTKATPTVSFAATTDSSATKSIPTFSFTSGSKSDGEGAKTTAPMFSFGKSVKSDGSEQKSFGFGTSGKESVGSNVPLAAPSFTFGSGNKTEIKGKEGGPAAAAMKINPLLKPNEKLPEKAAVAPVGFSFGLPKLPEASSATPIANKMSGANESSPSKRSKPADSESSMPPAKIPTFSFKTPSTNGDIGKSASLFPKAGEAIKPAASPVGGFSFSFGSGKPVPSTTTSGATVAPSFGSTASQADSSKQSMPMFSFGSSSETPKQANGFGFGSSPSMPAFGSKPTTSTTAETKPFSFGTPAASAQAPTGSFGTASPKPGLFSFGGTTDKPASFSFNAPSSENKSTNQFQSFGSTTPKTQPSFGFGQSPAPSFSFGTNQKTQSNFGTGSNPTNLFGAASSKPDAGFGATPAQSSGLNGAFNFGAAAATNQRAGFSFGASSATSEGSAPQVGFGFGSSTMNANAPSAPGGFNFATPTPTFDANQKPSFNFTGGAGITAFSAPPAQDVMPPRKIKKAIRRTVR